MIRKFIDIEYYKNSYKSIYANKIETEACDQFDFYAQKASEAIYNQVNFKFDILDQIPLIRVKEAIKLATANMLDHYWQNGTNMANIKTSNTTSGVSTSIEFLSDFNPSIVPDHILMILANEGIYIALNSDSDVLTENLEVVIDADVISTSVRTNLINKTQKEINEENDIRVETNTSDIVDLNTEVDKKVDKELYDTEQATQDSNINAVKTTADQNRELIVQLADSVEAGGVANESFRAPFDPNDATVGRTTVTSVGVNMNSPIRINPTRPDKLNYTQESTFKTIDVYDNGVLNLLLTGDIARATTNGTVRLKIDLIDVVGDTIVDTTTKTYDLTTNDLYTTQAAELSYEINDISTSNLKRSFYIKLSTLTVGNQLYILGGSNVNVALSLAGGVAAVANTDDILNLSTVPGISATNAFDNLNGRTTQNTTDISQNATNINNNSTAITTLQQEDVNINAKLDEIYNQLVED